jgi:galactonate dehydratase
MPALPFLAAAQSAGPKLARIEIFTVHVNTRGNWNLVRLTTSDGVTGLGEASHGARDAIVLQFLQTMFERLQGRGIWQLEQFRQDHLAEIAKGGRNAAVAYSALEQACWDIRGKLANRPVYDLLGGKLHDEIRNYANINRSTEEREPAAFGKLAEQAVAAGFDAIKLASFDGMPRQDAVRIREFTDRGVACIEAVRKAAGNAADVMRRLEPLRLYWLEEMSRDVQELAAFNKAAPMQTAGGESIFGAKAFYDYIAAGAVDIVMPDIKYCGGVMEMKKIAAMAEAAGLLVSPHGPASPVGNMIAVHVSATLPNFAILESAFGEVPWRGEIINPPERFVRGRLAVPGRPGYGIELNETEIARHKV